MIDYRGYDRRLVTTIIISLFLHGSYFWGVGRKESLKIITRIDDIEFIDENAPTIPETSIPKKSIFEAIRDRFKTQETWEEEPELEDVARMIQELPPIPGVDQGEGIDIGNSKQLDRSQVKGIDLDKFERMEGPEGGVTEVLRITSEQEQKSSEDILKGAPIKLDKQKRIPKDEPVGLFSSGGGRGLDLEKVPTKEIEREKRDLIIEEEEPSLENLIPEKKTEIKITGPLSKREIKYKPLPTYPDWAMRKGLTATVSLKVVVNVDGSVKPGIFVIKTSGYGSWDRDVIEAIKEWYFAPLHSDEPQILQTGMIIVRFILE